MVGAVEKILREKLEIPDGQIKTENFLGYSMQREMT